jgi:hypothetical protein
MELKCPFGAPLTQAQHHCGLAAIPCTELMQDMQDYRGGARRRNH